MPPAAADATRERLLEVAGPLFAERGYRDTGIKEICDAARCNVASVNYHFGSKEKFYAAVPASAHARGFAGNPMPEPDRSRPPADELRSWLQWWIGSMLRADRPVWLQTLIAREMAAPTSGLDTMVERSIAPIHARLRQILKALLPRGTAPGTVRLCANSVIGQILVYKHAAPVLERMGQMPKLNEDGIAALIEHVTRFSLAGIAGVAHARNSR